MKRSRSLEHLFYEAIGFPPCEERESWIRLACRGDRELESELCALLAVHDSLGDFLTRPIQIHWDEIMGGDEESGDSDLESGAS